jgi:hypothetical protein
MNENMKKMRLKLEDLKVQSFVTALSNEVKLKILGGRPPQSGEATCGCTLFNGVLSDCEQSLAQGCCSDPNGC